LNCSSPTKGKNPCQAKSLKKNLPGPELKTGKKLAGQRVRNAILPDSLVFKKSLSFVQKFFLIFGSGKIPNTISHRVDEN
jgi:hypothetical protein